MLPSRARILEGVVVSTVLAFVVLCSARPIWDIDIHWHVVAGRLFLERGEVVTRDTFSAIDPDRAWLSIVWHRRRSSIDSAVSTSCAVHVGLHALAFIVLVGMQAPPSVRCNGIGGALVF